MTITKIEKIIIYLFSEGEGETLISVNFFQLHSLQSNINNIYHRVSVMLRRLCAPI